MRRSLNANSDVDVSDPSYRVATMIIIKFQEEEDVPCNHVNFIRPEDSASPQPEYEFLFSAYSAFLVEQVDIHPNATERNPNRIVLLAARENDVSKQDRNNPKDSFPDTLPLSTWH